MWKPCLESSGTALKKSQPESEQNRPIVVQLSCTRLHLQCLFPAPARLRLEMKWETASARLGFAQALAVKCGLSSMSQLWHGIEFLKILKKFTRRNMKRPGQLLNLHRTNDKMSWGRTEAPAAVVRNKIPGKAWSCVQGPHPNQ